MTREEQRKKFWAQKADESLASNPRGATERDRMIAQLHDHPGFEALMVLAYQVIQNIPIDYTQAGWMGLQANLNGKREALDSLLLAVETAAKRLNQQPLAYQEVQHVG